MIQGQTSLKDLLFFHQIMAACKNSANPNGPVTRSRIKPSFFICYTLERLWPLPQPKRLRCDIVHGHLESLVAPLRATSSKSGVPPLVRRSSCHAAHFYYQQSLLWFLSGSALRALTACSASSFLFFRLLFENVKKNRGDECEASGSLRGHVVGQAPHNMPSKNFWKN